MPAPQFHTYDRKVQIASRDADPGATHAQREAGNAAVGRLAMHGFRVSIEYPKGAIRKGKGKDGKVWSRVLVGASYGYIRGTETASDGEHLDVWLGPHPSSQIGFLVSFLDADGNFDEYKTVLGTRNLAEAKKVIVDNYPADFWDTRVGEVRGFFLPDLKKHLKSLGVMRKSAAFFCKGCNELVRDRTEDQGCPTCDEKKSAGWRGLARVESPFGGV